MRKSTHTKDYRVFLELLAKARRKAGLTQAQLSQQLPFDQPGISKIERGERRIDVLELRLICRRIGVPLVEFVDELEKHLNAKHD